MTMIDIKIKQCLCRRNSIGYFHSCYDCGSLINPMEKHFFIIEGMFKNLNVCKECKEKENG